MKMIKTATLHRHWPGPDQFNHYGMGDEGEFGTLEATYMCIYSKNSLSDLYAYSALEVARSQSVELEIGMVPVTTYSKAIQGGSSYSCIEFLREFSELDYSKNRTKELTR